MIPNNERDEDAVRQRINSVLEKEKSSIYALSKETGVEQTKLNRQLSGTSRLSFETIKVFLQRFPRISAEWLLNGVGDMCCSDISDEELQRQVDEANARGQHIGGNSSHNTQTMTENNDVVIGMLRDQLAEKNEEIKFLRSLIAEMNQNK